MNSASIWGFETTACYSKPAFVAPTPLLRDPRSVIGRIQPQFENAHYGALLCIGPGSSSSSIEVSRHQINDLAAVQAMAMASRQSQEASREPSSKGRGRQVVNPVKAYKAVKAIPPKPPAIPKVEWHPVHPIPGSKEANAIRMQEAKDRGAFVMSDAMGDRGARRSEETNGVDHAAEAKKRIQVKRLRGKRKMGSRSTHIFY